MRLTSRGKRRLLIILIVAGLPVVGLALFVGLRDVYRSRLLEQSRHNGLTAYSQGDYAGTLRELGYVLSRNQNDAECLLAYADSRSRIFEVNGRHLISAARLYHALLKIDPTNLKALTSLLDLYKRLGYRAELIGIADRIIAAAPDHVEAWSVKASAAYRERRFDEVIDIAQRINGERPHDMFWRALHVRALLARGQAEDHVLALCDTWIERYSGDGRFRLFKAQVLCDFGRLDEARQELARAAEQGADSRDTLESMVSLFDELEMPAAADQLVARSKSKFAGRKWVFEAAIRRHWQASRPQHAMDELLEAERSLGDDFDMTRWRALLSVSLDRPQAASQAIDRLFKLAEAQPSSDRDRARAWAEALRARMEVGASDWLKVTETYERALSLDPDDVVLQYLLAEAYQRIGEHEMALLILETAADRDPNWSAIQVARADALLALGKSEEAFKTIATTIRRAPGLNAGAYLLLARAWRALGEAGQGLRLIDARTKERLDLKALLRTIHEQLGAHVLATPMLVEEHLRDGATQEAAALVESAIADEAARPAVLLALARVSQQWGMDLEARLIGAAAARGATAAQIALAESALWQHRGELDAALDALTKVMAGHEAAAASSDLQHHHATLLVRADRPEAAAVLERLLEQSTSVNLIVAMLAMEQVWRHESIVKLIVARLKALLGNRSPRALLAESNYLHRFKGDDPASIAEALKLVRSVLDVAPSSPEALLLMARLQVAGDDPQPQEAIRYLRRAIEIDPDELKAYPLLIATLYEQGDDEAAGRYLDQFSTRAAGNPVTLRLVCDFQQRRGEFDLALASMLAIPEETRSESDRVRIAMLRMKVGDVANAAAAFEQLLAEPTVSEETMLVGAEFFGATRQAAQGAALLEQAAAVEAAARARALGRLHVASGEHSEGARHFARALELEPADRSLHLDLARAQLGAGNLEAAQEAALVAAKLDPRDPGLLALLVAIGEALPPPQRQQLISRIADLQRSPGGLGAVVATLRLANFLSEPTEANLVNAKALIREHPSLMAAWRIAVRLHDAAGQTDEAAQLAKQAVARFPADTAATELACSLLIRLGRLDEALSIAQLRRQQSRWDTLPADALIAAILLDLNRPQEAYEQLSAHEQSILAQREESPDRLEAWLACLVRTARSEEALSLITPLLESSDWQARWVRVAQRVEPGQAQALIESTQSHLGATAAGRLQLAAAWMDVARRSGSSAAWKRADQIGSDLLDDPQVGGQALLVCAAIACETENFEAAEALYRQGLQREASNLVMLNNLADVLVRRGSGCAEAIELAERALKLKSDEPNILDTLAQAHLCSGQLDQAEQRARAALTVEPTNPSFRITLAAIRHAQGFEAEARRELETARRRLEASPARDPRLQRRIDDLLQRLERSAEISAAH